MRMAAVVLLGELAISGCAAQPEAAPTGIDLDVVMQQQLDDLWNMQSPSITVERPDVPVERIITTDEWAEVIGICLHDEGFPDVFGDGDGISFESNGDAQKASLNLAMYVCQARYPALLPG